MATVNLPELVIFEAFNRALRFIREDYVAQVDKNNTWLYKTFGGLTIERYNLYKEIVAIIVTANEEDPRFFKGDLMFNPKKNNVPSFHITLPSESPADGNTISMGEGSEFSFFEDTLSEDEQSIVSTEESVVYNRSMQATYNVIIMSDNPMEVVLLYHLMRAIVISSHMKFAHNNLINLSLGGQDLQPYKELAPQLYMRALTIGLQYSTAAIAMDTIQYFNDVEVAGAPVAN